MSNSDLFLALESAENGNDILLILEAIEALYWLDSKTEGIRLPSVIVTTE